MEEDIELSLSPARKLQPKQGRRSGHANLNDGASGNFLEDTNTGGNNLKSRQVSGDLFLDDNKTPSSGGPPLHGRRTGGWADENSRAKTAKSMRFADNGPENGGFGNADDSDEDDAMPIIPDLEDVRDEDMQLQVADAPSVAVNRVATYKELDSDLLKNVAFATLDDIDLRLLTKCLAPESALKEPDENWNWDVVFAQVSGELHKEWYSEGDKDSEPNLQPSGGEPNVQTDLDGPGSSNRITKERPYTAFNRFPV